MSRITHALKRNGTYWFKIDLPKDLAGQSFRSPPPTHLQPLIAARDGHRFKTAVWKSLRTSVERDAKRAAAFETVRYTALFDAARDFLNTQKCGPFSVDKAEEALRDYRRMILLLDEVQRQRGLGLSRSLQVGEFEARPGMSGLDYATYSDWVASRVAEAMSGIARRASSDRIGSIATSLLEKANVDVGSMTRDERHSFELSLLETERDTLRQVQQRLTGETVPTPQAAVTEATSWPISKAFKVWAEGGKTKGSKKPAANTVTEANAALRRFIELHGDLSVQDITKRHGREFRDAIASLPKNLPVKLTALPMKSLLALDLSGYESRSATTINKSLTLLSAVLVRAEKDGHFDDHGWRNPFDVAIDLDDREQEPYEPFSVTELNLLLASPVFAQGARPIRGRDETAKWAPLMALFHGARRDEFMQLYVRDVAADPDTGIWTIKFDRDAEKDIKNLASIRRTPVHPQLVALGFLDFLEERRRAVGSGASLWPGFEDRSKLESRIGKWGEWFNTYLAEHVVDHPHKKLHSMRGTFKRFSRESGLDEVVIDHLCGHAAPGVGRRYGRARGPEGERDTGYPLSRLASEIARVTFDGVDWSKLV